MTIGIRANHSSEMVGFVSADSWCNHISPSSPNQFYNLNFYYSYGYTPPPEYSPPPMPQHIFHPPQSPPSQFHRTTHTPHLDETQHPLYQNLPQSSQPAQPQPLQPYTITPTPAKFVTQIPPTGSILQQPEMYAPQVFGENPERVLATNSSEIEAARQWSAFNIECWEKLYPGWKYDQYTGQWYQVNGFDGTTSVEGSFDTTVRKETTEVSYSQPNSQSDKGFVLFKEAEESVKEVESDGGEENWSSAEGYEPWNLDWDWDSETAEDGVATEKGEMDDVENNDSDDDMCLFGYALKMFDESSEPQSNEPTSHIIDGSPERILEFGTHEFDVSVEEVNKELNEQKQGYENKITLLESELSSTSAWNSELELEVKSATDRCAEHEGKVNLTTQLGLELEDLIQSSHSKAEDAEKKVNQLELLLETEKYKIQELEGQISNLENKCREAEETSKNHFNKASELETEVEALQSKISSLDAALQLATEKENKLTESLKITTEEKINLGDALKNSTEKLVENENILNILRNELNLTQGRLESIESDLKASGMRETEVLEKLKFVEEQIEKHGSALEQATTRSLEPESLHSTVTKDSELKLREAIASFTCRDSEAKSLHDKVQALEDQVEIYKEQATEAAEKYASLKEEFNQIASKLASLEGTNEELKKKVAEAEDKAAQSFSENELLVQTNAELKNKIDSELQGLLDSANAEKETISQQLLAHVNTIAELNEAQTKATRLNVLQTKLSATSLEKVEAVGQLQSSQIVLEELKTQQIFDGEKLRTQISLLIEEKNLLTETHENSKKELQNVIQQLEGQLVSGLKMNADIGRIDAKSSLLEKNLEEIVARAEECISEQRVQKEEALKFCVIKISKVDEIEKEISVEVADLEKQRDELEAALKKVNISLEAANARLCNAREERDQSFEANDHIVAHLKMKEEELSRSVGTCAQEADVLRTWMNYLEDTWALQSSTTAETKEKEVSAVLGRHKKYEMYGDVACLDFAPVPERRRRFRSLAVGSYDNTIYILSLFTDGYMQMLCLQSLSCQQSLEYVDGFAAKLVTLVILEDKRMF